MSRRGREESKSCATKNDVSKRSASARKCYLEELKRESSRHGSVAIGPSARTCPRSPPARTHSYPTVATYTRAGPSPSLELASLRLKPLKPTRREHYIVRSAGRKRCRPVAGKPHECERRPPQELYYRHAWTRRITDTKGRPRHIMINSRKRSGRYGQAGSGPQQCTSCGVVGCCCWAKAAALHNRAESQSHAQVDRRKEDLEKRGQKLTFVGKMAITAGTRTLVETKQAQTTPTESMKVI